MSYICIINSSCASCNAIHFLRQRGYVFTLVVHWFVCISHRWLSNPYWHQKASIKRITLLANDKKMRSGHWLDSVLCVFFGALTPSVRHLYCKVNQYCVRNPTVLTLACWTVFCIGENSATNNVTARKADITASLGTDFRPLGAWAVFQWPRFTAIQHAVPHVTVVHLPW